jgi:hypothetical protein
VTKMPQRHRHLGKLRDPEETVRECDHWPNAGLASGQAGIDGGWRAA